MSRRIGDRLRELPLRPPDDLKRRALQAASVEPAPRRRAGWLQVAGAAVAVVLVVMIAMTVMAHPDPRVFQNISAGLGT